MECLIRTLDEKYAGYLSDETSEEGIAESISFPRSEEEAAGIVKCLQENGITDITVQGARTGLAGLAVPHGGHVINCCGMNKVIESGTDLSGDAYIKVQPGMTLRELNDDIRKNYGKRNLFWPPAPSEDGATIGGIAATGAYGMNHAGYGKTSDHITAIDYITADGEIHSARTPEETGDLLADRKVFRLITSVTLRLIQRPEAVWGAAFFFENQEDAALCADAMQAGCIGTLPGITVMEFIDHSSILLADESRSLINSLQKVPAFPGGTDSVIYIEAAGEEELIEETVMVLAETAAEYGADPDVSWALFSEAETEIMHIFRHSVTEAAALRMKSAHSSDPAVWLLSADIAVPGRSFSESLAVINDSLKESGAEAAVCAGICGNKFRLYIMPGDENEMIAGRELIKRLNAEGTEVVWHE